MVGAVEPGGWQEWKNHWNVLVPCFLGTMLVSTHGAVMGVMILPIEQEMGWARAEITAGFLFIAVVALFVSPLAGTAVDRIGPRKIGLFGILFYCSALAGLSTANDNVLSWWGLWIFLALAVMTVMPMVWLAVLNGYFVRSRGLAMAVCLSATGMGAAVFPMIANTLVEWVGWRSAYVYLAFIAALIAFPAAYFLFRPVPQAKPAVMEPETKSAPVHLTARGQAKSWRFFKLAAAAVVFAVGSSALTTNAVPVLVGEGLSPAVAAATVGLIGVGSIIGRLAGGFLLDRFNGNLIAAASCLLPIIPATIFLMTTGSQAWAAFACLLIGLSIGAEVDCCAYLASRHFGTRNFGALFGTINGLLLFGNGLAPILANYGYDVTRSYDIVLIGLIPLYIIAATFFATLGRYPELNAPVTTGA